MRHRIGDGGRHGAQRHLADAERRVLGRADETDHDFGDLAELEDGVGGPVAGRDAERIGQDLLLQGPARGLDGTAFDLVGGTVGIDHEPASATHQRRRTRTSASISTSATAAR